MHLFILSSFLSLIYPSFHSSILEKLLLNSFLLLLDMSLVSITAHVVLTLSGLAIVVNLPLVISMIKSWKQILFSDILLLNIFITNTLLGMGYSVPIYGYFINKNTMSIEPNCEFTGYFVFLVSCVNIATLQTLSFHQYILIKKPILGFRIKKRRDIGVYCVFLTWLFGIILPLPPLLGWSNYVEIMSGFSCELDFYSKTLENKSYVVFTTFLVYVFPAMSMAYLGYQCIFSKQLKRRNLRNPRMRMLNKKEHLFSVSVFVMFFSFLLSWSPYAVICIYIMADQPVNDVLHLICILFAKTSTVTCSVVYLIAYNGSKTLSLKIITLLRRKICENNTKNEEVLLVSERRDSPRRTKETRF